MLNKVTRGLGKFAVLIVVEQEEDNLTVRCWRAGLTGFGTEIPVESTRLPNDRDYQEEEEHYVIIKGEHQFAHGYGIDQRKKKR